MHGSEWRAISGTIATVATVLLFLGALAGLGGMQVGNVTTLGPTSHAHGALASPGVRAFVHPAAAALALSHASGPVGLSVVAVGTGFATAVLANVTWNSTTTLCSGTTNSTTGDLNCTFQVPVAVQGAHTVTMNDGTHTATATFTVDPAVYVSPASAGIGSLVTVTGTGYAAGSAWTVSWSGTPAITCTGTSAHTDTNGGFSCAFTVPMITAAAYTITAHDAVPNSATTTFTLPPATVTFAPADATVGSTVTANGTGFIASGATTYTAIVTWAPYGWFLCNPAIDSTGNFSCTFTVPDDVGGAHSIVASDPVGNTAMGTFTTDAALVLSPTSGPSGASAAATGSGFGGAAAATVTWSPGAGTLCTATTSAAGDFSCTFTVPAGTTGAHTVTGTAVGSANATYTVLGAVPTITLSFTSHFNLYMPLNLSLAWTITSSQPINTQTTKMWLIVNDQGSSACPFIGSHPTRVVKAPCQVVDLSLNYLLVNGTSSYSTVITLANLTSQSYNTGILPFDTGYIATVYVAIVNSGSTGTGSVSTPTLFLITHPATAAIVAPDAVVGVPTGNVSVAVAYSGDFVSGATVSIFTKSTPASLVYSSGVAVPGTGPRVGIGGSPWLAAVPGSYNAVVNLSGPWGFQTFTTPLTVYSAGGGTVYVNQSSYQNNSLIAGLSNGVTGMLLLLIGAIIGVIVAMVIGRMMWAGTSPKPAQAWQAKPNECSVCHQSFPDETELKDHMRKAHGM